MSIWEYTILWGIRYAIEVGLGPINFLERYTSEELSVYQWIPIQ